MASGKWVRIKTSTTGIHTVSDADLRKMGFSNPGAVNVYGLGGRTLDMGLCPDTPDDLPMLPCVRTAQGLMFYAADHNSWESSTYSRSTRPFTHSVNPYSEGSWYFLSDSGRGRQIDIEPVTLPGVQSSDDITVSFKQRLLHETELEPIGPSGCQVLGEDFRQKTQQDFDFQFPGKCSDDVSFFIRFGAKTSGGSKIGITADGKTVDLRNPNITSCPNENYCSIGEFTSSVTCASPKLKLGISHSPSGVLFKARLDYIEVFYDRTLDISEGQLHFYKDFNYGEPVQVRGCTSSTRIWDVTRPEAPVEVEFKLEGDRALFSVMKAGYREFAAFDPAKGGISAGTGSENVTTQNIHGLPTPDMVIITYPEYCEGAERIARLHAEEDGMLVHVLEPQAIYNEFSGGKKDVGAWRKMLKMWYDRGESEPGRKIRYCLIMGRPHYDNKMVSAESKSLGYNPMPIYESYEGLRECDSFCNDDWIGMVDDVLPHKFSMPNQYVRIGVGRLPVTSGKEALEMAEKIERYVHEPNYGPWRNKLQLIADDEDNGTHVAQTQKTYYNIRSTEAGRAAVVDRNYLDLYPRVLTGKGITYPQATARMLDAFKEGVIFANYIGHASPKNWGHEHLFNWEDIEGMDNRLLPFIYAATCGFAYWDQLEKSGAEVMMLNPDAGVIGMYAAARTVYISYNGELNNAFGLFLFDRDSDGMPLRFGDAALNSRNYFTKHSINGGHSNSLRYVLLGDPALRFPGGYHKVEVTHINDTDVTSDCCVYPELGAMSTARVKGYVADASGKPDNNFNGKVTLQLFDAERVIETLGNGTAGAKMIYNDRDKRLASVTAAVKGGLWEADIHVPPEIQGNYSPAQINAYAWTPDGHEGTGVTEKLYVYGYSDQALTDTVGPAIEALYVNRPEFEPGGVVARDPVLFARLRDESGINISQSGIGHSITLSVDGKLHFNDLGNYYEQDADDPEAGVLTYPMTGLEPGRHTLELTVWDNVNNFSTAAIDINVAAVSEPSIIDIKAFNNETAGTIDFEVTLDRPNTKMDCLVAIHDLNGRSLWESAKTMTTDTSSTFTARWDYSNSNGNRVPRGIYVCRVTVKTADGSSASKSRKVAVGAK